MSYKQHIIISSDNVLAGTHRYYSISVIRGGWIMTGKATSKSVIDRQKMQVTIINLFPCPAPDAGKKREIELQLFKIFCKYV